MRRPEVSPQVSIRDSIQVVAILPRYEKARLEWNVLQDDEVYLRQMHALLDMIQRVGSRGVIYASAIMLAGIGILIWGFPQDAVRLVTALREMPATDLVHQTGFALRYVLLISVVSALIADVVVGGGLPNAFAARCSTGCRQRHGVSEKGLND